MARVQRQRYSAAFKLEAVRLVQTSDQRITEIARHLGVTAKTLHAWVRLQRPRAPDRLHDDERTELERLRREVTQLRMERDIRKKAAAFFARETKD
jgi:transposase